MDGLLDELFPDLAAIALEGAKGVGKTATAGRRANTVLSLSDPRQRELLVADPEYFTRVKPPVLIDEWQLEPTTWDLVRHAVDGDDTGGRFLLAGSAGVKPGVRIHSGAGRIVSLQMRPLALSERGLIGATVSLGQLLSGIRPPISGESMIDLARYTEEILRSGFPGIRKLPERARTVQLDSYLTRIVTSELAESGSTVRHPRALTSWLAAYAAATSTDATYTTILDAATAGETGKPARQTVDVYREHLHRIFIIDPVPAWIPTLTPLRRLTHGSKHHLVDPALAARLVGIGRAGLLRGEGSRLTPGAGSWLGALFESLATLSVRVCASASHARVGHLRTKNGEHEIDLIVEAEDRRVVAIEVKLAATISDRDVRHLHWLQREIGDQLADQVILTTGRHAYRRPDGVAVVPLALLGP